MKKYIVFYFSLMLFLSGCAGALNSTNGYINPALKQLKGEHIALVIDRVNIASVSIDMLDNKYYLYKECEPSNAKVASKICGSMYFITDTDGFITDYIEDGYRHPRDFQTQLKDLLANKK